jgi:histidine triad (HIT) family protein
MASVEVCMGGVVWMRIFWIGSAPNEPSLHKRRELLKKPEGCTLCGIANHKIPAAIIHEDDDIIAILDLFPATTGHALILPKSHIEDIYSLPEGVGGKIMAAAIRLSTSIRSTLAPQGLNLIQANGTAAGQTIRHFHLHLVPRYDRDGVSLQFGHGMAAEDAGELNGVAALIRKELKP